MMAGGDLNHLIQGEYGIPKLLKIAAAGNALAPAAALQVIIDDVLVVWR
jgi:hypothetical protein